MSEAQARYYDAELAKVTGKLFDALNALDAIWKIVHTPTKLTRHRMAKDHFQADFDSIRKIIADARSPHDTITPEADRG